jgi:hypothetical protein
LDKNSLSLNKPMDLWIAYFLFRAGRVEAGGVWPVRSSRHAPLSSLFKVGETTMRSWILAICSIVKGSFCGSYQARSSIVALITRMTPTSFGSQ